MQRLCLYFTHKPAPAWKCCRRFRARCGVYETTLQCSLQKFPSLLTEGGTKGVLPPHLPTIALSFMSLSAEPTQSLRESHPAGNMLRGQGSLSSSRQYLWMAEAQQCEVSALHADSTEGHVSETPSPPQTPQHLVTVTCFLSLRKCHQACLLTVSLDVCLHAVSQIHPLYQDPANVDPEPALTAYVCLISSVNTLCPHTVTSSYPGG